MIGTTLSVIETLLAADGVSAVVIRTVREVIESDGMVPTGRVCKSLGLSTWTVRRLCERHGVRRVSRPGRQGALVHLPSLQAAMATGCGAMRTSFLPPAADAGVRLKNQSPHCPAPTPLLKGDLAAPCPT